MKVLNYTTSYFAVILLVIISIWAAVFYYSMLDEIYDSIDDGLDNQKGLIIQKASRDSSILGKNTFEEGDYAIKPIQTTIAKEFRDVSIDTMMYMQNEQDYEPVRLLRTVFRLNGNYYQMDVITSMVEEDDLIKELFYALLWLYLGLVATILILNNFLLKRIWRPFYHLLKQVRSFRLEKPNSLVFQKTKIDEFRLLNETIQKLLQSNIDSYTSQKHFIENASHELQTPLAIGINKLEALAERNVLSPEDLKLLSSALDNLERLTRLNKSLLLLSMIENRQFGSETEININQVIKKVIEDFSDQLEYANKHITLKEDSDIYLFMNVDLASILFTNLIKNAIIHNSPNGGIEIVISKTHVDIISGDGGPSLDKDRLFKRFNSNFKTENSTGLGLAIVKAIADLYHFKLEYTFRDKHIFTLYFK